MKAVRLPMRSLALALAVACFATQSMAAVPRALPAGQLPNDARLAPPKDLNGYFPFTPPATKDAWPEQIGRAHV